MNSRDRQQPEQELARGFAQHVLRWSKDSGADQDAAQALWQAAHDLSLATSGGHVCIGLAQLPTQPGGPSDSSSWRRLLLDSGLVGSPRATGSMPMILDDEDRLYLHRYFDYERRLAERLHRSSRASPLAQTQLPALQRRLSELFAGNAERLGSRTDWQKLAAALALCGRLTIISGGPGTGKTTTVVNLLACLIELDPDCRIALCAPTGKAAARMTEAIRLRASHLGEDLSRRLPTESFTVHRLLGFNPSGGYRHDADHPLAIDALVVDEASMLDLALATRLLEAVPQSARILLLGDKDQLAAVESGSVFSEISGDPTLSRECVAELAQLAGIAADSVQTQQASTPSALRDAVVWFSENFRFARDSGIGRLAALINAGQAQPALDWLGQQSDPGVRWIDDGDAGPSAQTLQCLREAYADFVAAVKRNTSDFAAVSAAFARFRLLCAVREGPRGVLALNEVLSRWFRAELGPLDRDPTSPWYPGRPILVLRNDYVMKLFNGDIGITLPDPAGDLLVYFPDSTGAGFRAVAPLRLPQHETAFAMTVHKSQGSEFEQVLLLLPEQRSPVLTRELLYTAVTRARSHLTLSAGPAAISTAVAASTRRHSGLLARLRECAAAVDIDAR